MPWASLKRFVDGDVTSVSMSETVMPWVVKHPGDPAQWCWWMPRLKLLCDSDDTCDIHIFLFCGIKLILMCIFIFWVSHQHSTFHNYYRWTKDKIEMRYDHTSNCDKFFEKIVMDLFTQRNQINIHIQWLLHLCKKNWKHGRNIFYMYPCWNIIKLWSTISLVKVIYRKEIGI